MNEELAQLSIEKLMLGYRRIVFKPHDCSVEKLNTYLEEGRARDATIARLTQTNAELTAEVKQHYSHRNGETEPPTREGFYWLRQENLPGDVVHVTWQVEIPFGDKVGIQAGWIISGEIDHYVDELAVAQWWGPLTPPWDAPT